MRTNTYKQKILSLLNKKHLLTMTEILKEIPEADFSTIFRNIKQLCDEKIVKKVVINDKTVSYELSLCHHNHFVCDDCGIVDTIDLKLNKSSIGDLKISDIVVHGSCAKCNQV